MDQQDRDEHVAGDDEGRRPRPGAEDHEQRRNDLAHVDQIADALRHAGFCQHAGDRPDAPGHLRHAVEQDQQTDRDAQQQLAGVFV